MREEFFPLSGLGWLRHSNNDAKGVDPANGAGRARDADNADAYLLTRPDAVREIASASKRSSGSSGAHRIQDRGRGRHGADLLSLELRGPR
jgi:hypothetical protein